VKLVSVIIPLYNKGKYISRALDSVLKQSFQNYTIIIIDDGSTDDGPKIVKAYDDPRVFLIQQENKGVGSARNRGIHESSSKYIAFLDADDEWLPSYLSESYQALENNMDCSVCISGSYQDFSNDVLGRKDVNVVNILKSLGASIVNGAWEIDRNISDINIKYILNFFNVNTVFAYRDVLLESGGFCENSNYGEDYYLWLTLLMNYRIYRNPVPLAWYHDAASELNGSYAVRHVEAFLCYPDEIRERCPSEKKEILERFFAIYALQSAHNRISVGKQDDVEYLMNNFPKMKQYSLFSYIKLIIKLKLNTLALYP